MWCTRHTIHTFILYLSFCFSLQTILTPPDTSSLSSCQSHLALPLLLPTHTTDPTITTITPSHPTITPSHYTSHSCQTGTIYLRLARLPADSILNKTLRQEKGSKRASRIARRLYGGHTFMGAGQLKNSNEDEQTRIRLDIQCNLYYPDPSGQAETWK